MEQFLVTGFYYMMKKLEEVEQNLYEHSTSTPLGTEISAEHDKYIRVIMRLAREKCNALKMKEWIDEPIMRISHVLARINGHSGDAGGRSYSAVQYEIQALRKSIHHSLQSRLFLYMTPEDAAYYGKDDLFGIKEKFPEANKEIVEAGNCYGAGSYTACVFHLMRAVEIGARKLINALHARQYLNPPNRPVELCTWDDLLKALDKGVADLVAGTRNDPRKKATYEFYNHAVAQFRNFKDAWRNNVSHKRETYQQGKAKDIMDNTRQFMQHLAERLKE